MRKKKKNFLWLCKILLVALMIYAQVYSPIVVFAEELTPSSDEETEEKTDTKVTPEENIDEEVMAPETEEESEKQSDVILTVEGATKNGDSYVMEGVEVNFKWSSSGNI